ncbi:hypothetical protein ACFL4Z_03170 [candidate division KSB1 bacterium]
MKLRVSHFCLLVFNMAIKRRAFLYWCLLSCISAAFVLKTDAGKKKEPGIVPESSLREYIKFFDFANGPIPEYEKRAAIVIMPGEGDKIRIGHNGIINEIDATATAAYIRKVLPEGSFTISPISPWAQDMFKTTINKGTLEFVLSSKPPSFLVSTEEEIREFINCIFNGHRIIKAPFSFEGGGIMFDRLNGKIYVFTDSTHKEHDVKAIFKADKEINLPFADIRIHLDEILIFLGYRKVCIAYIVGNNLTEKEAKHFSNLNRMLSKSRKVLTSLGYSIVDIPVDYSDVRNGTTHLNCIQFKDRSNLSNIIVPHFENTNEELFKQVIDIYRREVDRVHPIRDITAPFDGSLHCITNVIF